MKMKLFTMIAAISMVVALSSCGNQKKTTDAETQAEATEQICTKAEGEECCKKDSTECTKAETDSCCAEKKECPEKK